MQGCQVNTVDMLLLVLAPHQNQYLEMVAFWYINGKQKLPRSLLNYKFLTENMIFFKLRSSISEQWYEAGARGGDISIESRLGWDWEILQHLHNHISLWPAFYRSQHLFFKTISWLWLFWAPLDERFHFSFCLCFDVFDFSVMFEQISKQYFETKFVLVRSVSQNR